MYFLLGFTLLIFLVFQLLNPLPQGCRYFLSFLHLSVTLSCRNQCPRLPPALSASPEQGLGGSCRLQGAKILTLGEGGKLDQHKPGITAAKFPVSRAGGKGSAPIPPRTQQGKHGPFPAAFHHRDPDEPESCKRRTQNK